jgi:peptidylprolyl isomerase
MRRILVLLALVAWAGAAPAQQEEPHLIIEMGGSTAGSIDIALRPDLAPRHVERITELARTGAYDGIVFHRVIDGFMAQTGDVQFGHHETGDPAGAGRGGSAMADLPAEFSSEPFARGTVGMARSRDPNSANSQFFIMFGPAPHLNGQYTVVGEVVDGMAVVDAIKRGDPGRNGVVTDPDYMARVTVRQE